MRASLHMIRSGLFLVLAASSALVGGTACGAPERLTAVREETLGLREVSGLARGRLDGAEVILAVGDEAYSVTVIPMVKDLPDPAHARTIPVALPHEARGSNLEGVAFDAQGHVWLLSESDPPALTETIISGDTATIVARSELVVPPEHALAAAWAKDANLRGEGLVVEDARVLVVKQKDPTALIAFTRSGDRWVAGTWWSLPLEDASDLARSADGSLFVIGAGAARICKLDALAPNGGEARCARLWGLPEALGKGTPQWEGLTFLDDGRPLVAVDRKKAETANMAILPNLP